MQLPDLAIEKIQRAWGLDNTTLCIPVSSQMICGPSYSDTEKKYSKHQAWYWCSPSVDVWDYRKDQITHPRSILDSGPRNIKRLSDLHPSPSTHSVFFSYCYTNVHNETQHCRKCSRPKKKKRVAHIRTHSPLRKSIADACILWRWDLINKAGGGSS